MASIINEKTSPCATCQHCGKVTNIQMSRDFRRLMAHYKTKKETLKFSNLRCKKIHIMKNGQIQSLHKAIKHLLDLMTDEQKEEAKKINKVMRDELKYAEKQALI